MAAGVFAFQNAQGHENVGSFRVDYTMSKKEKKKETFFIYMT